MTAPTAVVRPRVPGTRSARKKGWPARPTITARRRGPRLARHRVGAEQHREPEARQLPLDQRVQGLVVRPVDRRHPPFQLAARDGRGDDGVAVGGQPPDEPARPGRSPAALGGLGVAVHSLRLRSTTKRLVFATRSVAPSAGASWRRLVDVEIGVPRDAARGRDGVAPALPDRSRGPRGGPRRRAVTLPSLARRPRTAAAPGSFHSIPKRSARSSLRDGGSSPLTVGSRPRFPDEAHRDNRAPARPAEILAIARAGE